MKVENLTTRVFQIHVLSVVSAHTKYAVRVNSRFGREASLHVTTPFLLYEDTQAQIINGTPPGRLTHLNRPPPGLGAR